MLARPRTAYVLQKKSRRCPKCNMLLNSQRTRCKRCNAEVPFPKKRGNKKRKKTKFRTTNKQPRAK